MMASFCSGLVPSTGRRAFLEKVSTSVVAAGAVGAFAGVSPAFAAKKDSYDPFGDVGVKKSAYDLDVSGVVQEKPKQKADAGAGKLVGGIAAGGLLLSVPFFLPNLIRLSKKLGGGDS